MKIENPDFIYETEINRTIGDKIGYFRIGVPSSTKNSYYILQISKLEYGTKLYS